MNAKRKRWRWWAAAAVVTAVPALLLLLNVSCNNKVDTPPSAAKADETPKGPPYFDDVTAASGIVHTYKNGEEAGHLAILESLGGGALLIDFDGDGLLDVFLPGGGMYGGPDKQDITGRPCKLYKNLGGFKFKDVTAEVGLDAISFYTHGGAVADYDRDGWPDLLVTGWGRLALYHNESDGKGGRRFVDVTKKAGLAEGLWTTSAGFADFDGDGHVDLYACQYVTWRFGSKETHPNCTYDGKTPDVCPPKQFKPLPHVVYRNNGNGTFSDVSKSCGLRVPRTEAEYDSLKKDFKEEASARMPEKDAEEQAKNAVAVLKAAEDPKEVSYGKGLGVVVADVNLDGKPDVYVCNDTVDNFLYINRSRPGKILFEEVGLGAGVARDERGQANGSMGCDVGDPLGTGRPSVWVTNYENELHALYLNDCKDGRVIFRYGTQLTGIAAIGQSYVGWGTHFLDLDLDGWQDLVVSNGHAIRFPPKTAAQRAEKPVLLMNYEDKGRRKFRDETPRGGSYFTTGHVGRGVAFGDLDNDGRVDMVMANLNEPTAVVRGVGGEGHHWLGVALKRKENRDSVGARVILEAGGRKQARFAKGGGSYASASDPRHVFGLGKGDKIDRVTVVWPTGEEQTWEGLAVDQYWVLTEGQKEAKPAKK